MPGRILGEVGTFESDIDLEGFSDDFQGHNDSDNRARPDNCLPNAYMGGHYVLYSPLASETDPSFCVPQQPLNPYARRGHRYGRVINQNLQNTTTSKRVTKPIQASPSAWDQRPHHLNSHHWSSDVQSEAPRSRRDSGDSIGRSQHRPQWAHVGGNSSFASGNVYMHTELRGNGISVLGNINSFYSPAPSPSHFYDTICVSDNHLGILGDVNMGFYDYNAPAYGMGMPYAVPQFAPSSQYM